MFKKTEESEWSRFSRALSSQSKAGAEEEVVREEPAEPVHPPREAQLREPAQPVVTPPPAPARPTPAQSYARPHSPAHQQEVDEAETVIGVSSSVDGTLKCESNLRVKGSAQGEIACAKSVIIEESARVNANVRAANAIVAGQLEGSIVCSGRLEILATGRVAGELTAGVLIIQEGAFFEGHLKMKERGSENKAAVEPPAGRKGGSPDAVVN